MRMSGEISERIIIQRSKVCGIILEGNEDVKIPSN